MKVVMKRTVIFIAFAMTMTLIVDHLHYTIKTEHLSDYTTRQLAAQLTDETEIELLASNSTAFINVLFFKTRLGSESTLWVMAYRKSPISQAFQMVKQIKLSPYDGSPLDKSFLVNQFGHKMLVLFGINSQYNIRVMRNRVASDYYETSEMPNYLVMLEDIEHLYFYYETNAE
ncbi:hypothetical protein KHM83_15450 [Fusibacter paucivorans]|uniref:Uncharacterized protein n=1 Tax=Fusibacter paucivorans TaxID=76009 RepID=A0ABS5PUN5_9FIRM|nr:hypothetical protein [Fusibacter paucivorans]MBS7528081.1 hypothetical protein [Fusibacter paucivorans]